MRSEDQDGMKMECKDIDVRMKNVIKKTFILKYRYRAWELGIREVLKISKDTVTNVLKKESIIVY